MTRIEICGGIASGKTTFASLLSRNGFDPIYENFKANPFWEAFYTVPVKYNFETEICFMLQHYHELKRKGFNGKKIACDYSFLLDMAYAEMGLKGSQLDAFKVICEQILKELPKPTLIVYLQCDASIELERIRKRARAVEDNITFEFLDGLNKAVACQVARFKNKFKIITIDSADKNFADDDIIKNEMLLLVAEKLSSQ
jgi:deoxyadenosine/deoxycytidine kinase